MKGMTVSDTEDDKKPIAGDSAVNAVEMSGKKVGVLSEEGVRELMEQVKSEFRKETERQVLLERASLITIFGLFASITSFLIVEFQCLKAVNGVWEIVGFSCTAFALLLGFNIGLDYLIKSRFDEGLKLHRHYIAFVALFFVIGCGAIVYGEKQAHWCKKESVCDMHERVEQVGVVDQGLTPQ